MVGEREILASLVEFKHHSMAETIRNEKEETKTKAEAPGLTKKDKKHQTSNRDRWTLLNTSKPKFFLGGPQVQIFFSLFFFPMRILLGEKNLSAARPVLVFLHFDPSNFVKINPTNLIFCMNTSLRDSQGVLRSKKLNKIFF